MMATITVAVLLKAFLCLRDPFECRWAEDTTTWSPFRHFVNNLLTFKTQEKDFSLRVKSSIKPHISTSSAFTFHFTSGRRFLLVSTSRLCLFHTLSSYVQTAALHQRQKSRYSQWHQCLRADLEIEITQCTRLRQREGWRMEGALIL